MVAKCGYHDECSCSLDVLNGDGGWIGEFIGQFREIVISGLALYHEGSNIMGSGTYLGRREGLEPDPSSMAKMMRTTRKKAGRHYDKFLALLF